MKCSSASRAMLAKLLRVYHLTAIRNQATPGVPCGECGHPNPGNWCDGCGWQR